MEAQYFDIVVITPEKDFPEETSWVNRLFANGLCKLHLRKPGRNAEDLIQYLERVEEEYHERIMVHYREEVMKAVGVRGIHYKYSALPPIKPDYSVSCGCHSWEEFREIESRVDYAFVSPFFDSTSKQGYKAGKYLWDLPGESSILKAIALGGIREENILQLKKLPLKGAAVLGAVWESEDPLKAFLRLRSIVEDLKVQN